MCVCVCVCVCVVGGGVCVHETTETETKSVTKYTLHWTRLQPNSARINNSNLRNTVGLQLIRLVQEELAPHT